MPIAGPANAPDVRRNLEAGTLLIGAGAVLLFVSLFLEWFQRGLDAFEIFEVWDLVLAVLAIGALIAVASRFGFGPPRPSSWLAAPAIAAFVIVLYALVNPPPVAAGISDDPSTGLWLALAASVLMAAGAVLSVARISVALAPGSAGVAGPLAGRHAGVTHPADPRAGAPVAGDPAVPPQGGLYGRGPGDPVEPMPPPTQPTRRI